MKIILTQVLVFSITNCLYIDATVRECNVRTEHDKDQMRHPLSHYTIFDKLNQLKPTKRRMGHALRKIEPCSDIAHIASQATS